MTDRQTDKQRAHLLECFRRDTLSLPEGVYGLLCPLTCQRRSIFGEVVIRSLICTILALEHRWRSTQAVSPRIHVGAQRWRLPGTTIVKEFRAEG